MEEYDTFNPLENPKSRLSLLDEVEKARKHLILDDSVQLSIENLDGDDNDFEGDLEKDELETII